MSPAELADVLLTIAIDLDGVAIEAAEQGAPQAVINAIRDAEDLCNDLRETAEAEAEDGGEV